MEVRVCQVKRRRQRFSIRRSYRKHSLPGLGKSFSTVQMQETGTQYWNVSQERQNGHIIVTSETTAWDWDSNYNLTNKQTLRQTGSAVHFNRIIQVAGKEMYQRQVLLEQKGQLEVVIQSRWEIMRVLTQTMVLKAWDEFQSIKEDKSIFS